MPKIQEKYQKTAKICYDIYGGYMYNELDFTFLTEEQIFGDDQLGILRNYGTKCAITDFSILLGGYVAIDYYTSEGNSRKDRTGCWWTKTPYDDNVARVVSNRGDRSNWFRVYERADGARPALPYSSISSISSNGVIGRNGILEVEYGEYPQTVVSEDFSRILEKAFVNMPYSNNEMKTTGKSYTTDSVRFGDTDTPFRARTHTEYEYNGKKYIRFVGDSNCEGEVLSDGRKIKNGDVCWVEVEPIKWMIDERANIALSKKIIFSGVQFNRESNYKGDFSTTDIKQFMDEYFSKDIIPSMMKELTEEEKKELEELKRALSEQAMGAGSSTNSNIRNITNIGRAKPLIDWRYVLREAIKYDVDWSYRNATIENGVISANLEEQPMPETEIVLDTSGSINEALLKNFLRECKNILQHSRLKVGCFDTEFYGFHEIRTENDIENMKFEGGGGYLFVMQQPYP